ncbi:MAG: glutathione-regulated potassium-efflux system protein KefC [Bdellovibrionales bacterium]
MEHFLLNALVFLLSAIISVPIFHRLGLGSVLGYLVAGVVIGPWGLKLISNVTDILHFSEFGVVLLLFIIGLELEPKKLWQLRVPIFGMGGAQVLLNTFVFTLLGILLGYSWSVSFLVGMGFSLSSTAIALQVLKEKNQLTTTSGQAAFSILLFQDIAVIAMIALLPILGVSNNASSTGSEKALVALKVFGVLLTVITVGRILLRHILRIIASTHMRDIFTAFALFLVFGMAALMHWLEISMALGAFLAGVLLADSEYRHALETDIEPFKGLLLGLFFISVGMSIDFGSIQNQPFLILALALSVFILKTAVHFAVGRFFRLPKMQLPFFSLVIAQVGEFAFVLFGAAQAFKILSGDIVGVLLATVAFSMLATPFVVKFHDFVIEPFLNPKKERVADTIEEQNNPVIIAGFGRFGQIVGRLLFANKIPATILDHEPDQIESLRRFGFKVYYGDATRLDLLESAGAANAKVLVVAIDNVADNLKLIDLAKQHFPHLTIFARARNVQHVYELLDRKVHLFERETFESSLRLGVDVLKHLGYPAYQAVTASHKFREHNNQMIRDIHPTRKDQVQLVAKAKQAGADLEKMFEEDAMVLKQQEEGWHPI